MTSFCMCGENFTALQYAPHEPSKSKQIKTKLTSNVRRTAPDSKSGSKRAHCQVEERSEIVQEEDEVQPKRELLTEEESQASLPGSVSHPEKVDVCPSEQGTQGQARRQVDARGQG